MSNQPKPTSREEAAEQGRSDAAVNAKAEADANKSLQAETVDEKPSEPAEVVANKSMTREELNAIATEKGVETPEDTEKYPTKGDLLAAIEAQ